MVSELSEVMVEGGWQTADSGRQMVYVTWQTQNDAIRPLDLWTKGLKIKPRGPEVLWTI